jgi:hypothetical protein
MTREKAERLGTIFLAVFAIGLAAVMAADGMGPMQKLGALLAVSASMALATMVRIWKQPEPKAVKVERD